MTKYQLTSCSSSWKTAGTNFPWLSVPTDFIIFFNTDGSDEMKFPLYPTDFISSQQWWVLICIQESKPSISVANHYTKNLHPECLHFLEVIRKGWIVVLANTQETPWLITMSPIVCSFKLQQSGDSRTELCEEDMEAILQLIWVQNLCTSCWTQKKSTKVEHTLCPLNLVNNQHPRQQAQRKHWVQQ